MIHSLEQRLLLADMTLTGTSGKENISIRQTNTSTTAASIEVSNGGSAGIVVKVGATASTVGAGAKKSFTNIGKITLVDLGAGDDKFVANSTVKIPVTVSGGDGKDTITGGSAADVISGDKATGTGFTDSIQGGGGNDTLYGYAGNDVILAEAGNDSVRAGTGNDIVNGGANLDKIFGEDGNDSFFNVDGAIDSLDGGAGSDTSEPIHADKDVATKIENVAAAAGVDQPNGAVFTVSGTDGNDRIGASVDSSGALSVTINGITVKYTKAERERTLSNAGLSTTGANRIFIRGKGGNDTITAGAGVEYINGDAGNDTLAGVAKTMVGGPGNDKITAQGDFPTQICGDSDNFTNALEPSGSNEGFDSLFGTKYNDTIDAGGGNDYVKPGQSLKRDINSNDELIRMFGFTSGRDTIDFGDRTDALTITFSSAGNDVTVQGRSGNLSIFNQDDNTAVIKGGSGNDTFNGSNNAMGDSLEGNGGNDSLFGNGANDTLRGGSGNDRLLGGDGNDLLDLGAGNDFADGGNNDDTILNADGSIDTIDGGAGSDKAKRADGDVLSNIEIFG